MVNFDQPKKIIYNKTSNDDIITKMSEMSPVEIKLIEINNNMDNLLEFINQLYHRLNLVLIPDDGANINESLNNSKELTSPLMYKLSGISERLTKLTNDIDFIIQKLTI